MKKSIKNVSHLQDRNGIKYEVNSEKPFTGILVKKYKNRQKKIEEHYKDGRLDGLVTEWYENGQKKSELNWTGDEQDENSLVYSTDWDEEGNITKTETYRGAHFLKDPC